jgi:hypothetical protein
MRDGRGAYGVSHMLPSIPMKRRMIYDERVVVDGRRYAVPPDAIRNLTYFLESRIRPDEEDRPLYVYNPMLLPLDPRYVDSSVLNDVLAGGYDDETYPAYVAVYRVSNFANCHGVGRGVPETFRSYLGLALLDVNLRIVRGKERREENGKRYSMDVVIDLNRHMFYKIERVGNGAKRLKAKQHMEDCQLIAAPFSSYRDGRVGNAKADGLVLLCNGYAMRVRLERTPCPPPTGGRVFHTVYGSGLRLTALEMPNEITIDGRFNIHWKNMHYFRDDGGEGYLEVWPGGPHASMRMDFMTYNGTVVSSSRPEPDASFVTIESLDGTTRMTPRDSGSACCISIRWPNGDDGDNSSSVGEVRRLLLGFSHRKTRHDTKGRLEGTGYNYVSRIYAFQPTPPFDIVAMSGFFCLGFALGKRFRDAPINTSHASDERSHAVWHFSDDDAIESENEQVWGAANDYRLKIGGMVFDNCPRIHFVSGIADKMGDEEETAIISYGVNDCYPRMIEVPKKFLVSLLKQPPKELKQPPTE